MEERGPIYRARRDFRNFARDLHPHPDDESYRYLQAWLGDWLIRGDGVAATAGNYETWLRTCVDIADAVFRQEINLDVDGIHEPSQGAAQCFDRVGYEAVVYQREHPDPS